ncbi:exonuclease domain-containing protein [Salinarimonas rosea]|uniref:exonuclease domain-containing protein n=1 Tax=Salinarimonas rosea TaxID=552063 RepID=UPI0003F6A364|nr:exonuclease domain-containing protein [Salinarimonas rosea]
MDYCVLDVETASSDCGSICQIGIVRVVDGAIVEEHVTLVDPCCTFSPFNIRVHGIRAQDVAGAPTFQALYADLCERLTGRLVVQQGGFDKTALARAAEACGCAEIDARWINNVSVARRAWPGLPGYGLAKLAARLGFSFRHHDALEDARVTQAIFARAVAETGIPPHDWPARLAAPVQRKAPARKPTPAQQAKAAAAAE